MTVNPLAASIVAAIVLGEPFGLNLIVGLRGRHGHLHRVDREGAGGGLDCLPGQQPSLAVTLGRACCRVKRAQQYGWAGQDHEGYP